MPAIRAEMGRQHATIGRSARLFLYLEHDRAGAVSEQHAVPPVVPVQNARKCLSPDYQRPLEGARAQEIIGGGECKDKAGAHGLQIEGGTMVDTEPILDSDGGCRKGVVRRR